MILTCPSCQQKYMVTNRSIGAAGRMVRCDSCQHEWFESSPTEESFGTVAPTVTQPATAAESKTDFDSFTDPFAVPAADSSVNRTTDFSTDFQLPPDLGKASTNPDDYSFDSPEWQADKAASPDIPAMPAEFSSPVIREPVSSEPVPPRREQPSPPQTESAVKNIFNRISLGKSDTEIEFESMIKELDKEMVGLGDMPDLDQLTSFHTTTPKSGKKGKKVKKSKNRIKKPRSGNFTVAVIVSAVMGLIVMGFFFGRGLVVDLMPQLGKAYRLAGLQLPVKNIGLDFQEIRFEKSNSLSSVMVRGTVLNLSNLPKTIPQLEASAHNGQGELIKTWHLTLSLPILLPGDNTEFRAPIDNIPPATSEITVNFLAR